VRTAAMGERRVSERHCKSGRDKGSLFFFVMITSFRLRRCPRVLPLEGRGPVPAVTMTRTCSVVIGEVRAPAASGVAALSCSAPSRVPRLGQVGFDRVALKCIGSILRRVIDARTSSSSRSPTSTR
jgi:hypothetical protein